MTSAPTSLPSIAAASSALVSAAQPHGVLLTTFTDAGGFLTALNWALYVRSHASKTPAIGLDGPAPASLSAQWSDAKPLFYSLPGGTDGAKRNGLERWTIRWVGLAALLDVNGLRQVVLSDTDVVWLRDPSPYFAALARLHPHLDVAVGTDHATYAEAFRDDLPYSSTATPTRRDVLSQWQRVVSESVPSSSASDSGTAHAPDFDLDPHPVNGANDGTWNPGILLAHATPGGRAFVAAEIEALGAAGRDLGARGLSDASLVSDQSEMCRMLRQLLAMKSATSMTGLEHARDARDPSLLRVPLQLNSTSGAALGFGGGAERQELNCAGGRGAKRALRRRARGAAPNVWWWCDPYWRTRLHDVYGVRRVDATAGVGLLPVLQFGSFLATRVVREAGLYGAAPFALHATHIVGDKVVFKRNNLRPMGPCTHPVWCLGEAQVTTGAIKAFTLRQYRLWAVRDSASYFAGGYLTYANQPARRYRRFATHATGDAQWAEHLDLLQEQLQDFQAALAAALALNRTLVLPRMLCSCIYGQWPFTTKGNLNCQPTHMQGLFPRLYECPPTYWLSAPDVLRSDVPLREASFLDHPRARDLRASSVTLHACDGPAGTPAGSGEPAAQLCTVRGVPLVRARAASEEFARALAPLHRARVLHLDAPRMAVGGFADARGAEAFSRRAGALLGAWCCAEEGGEHTARPRARAGRGRRRAGGFSGGGEPPRPLEDLADDADTHLALHGAAFKLRFRPPLGVLSDARRAQAKRRWEVVTRVNNVFGRAELRRDTSCCKYVGQAESLDACMRQAEAKSASVTSITWHSTGVGGWRHSCYAIVDGTWQPVPVDKGQAEADSARLVGGRPLGPAPELGSAWIADR